ncbi:MAG: hydroxypyruvate isomerase [Alphaproteobacteria bacterium]|nr:MAG: hydroxypyruvate isomerase [Alphaproteobacteria bacterium]
MECHWPYDEDAGAVQAALAETGLSMLGLNAPRGNVGAGENGLAALVGRETEARAGIDAALDYADAIDAGNIHVLSGFAGGEAAEACFVENLRYAADAAAPRGRTILIEPLNHHDAPGYFLNHTERPAGSSRLGAPNLKLMFDCYHIQILEGDLTRRIDANLDITGHIQFAGVPSRGRPDMGEVNYAHIFAHLAARGYDALDANTGGGDRCSLELSTAPRGEWSWKELVGPAGLEPATTRL